MCDNAVVAFSDNYGELRGNIPIQSLKEKSGSHRILFLITNLLNRHPLESPHLT